MSAIFSKETSEAIKREDKLGVLGLSKSGSFGMLRLLFLMVGATDSSLFGVSAGDGGHGYGCMLPAYGRDETVDEHSLYAMQRRNAGVGRDSVGNMGCRDAETRRFPRITIEFPRMTC